MNLIEEIEVQNDLFQTLLGDDPLFKPQELQIDTFALIQNDACTSVSCNDSKPRIARPPKVSCTCQKSKCNQNYCPCFKQGNKCNHSCKCSDCANKIVVPRQVTYRMGSFEQFMLAPFSFE